MGKKEPCIKFLLNLTHISPTPTHIKITSPLSLPEKRGVFLFFFFTNFVMFASRLRLVSTRLAIHGIKPFAIKNAIKVVSTAHISRSYATKSGKQVSYTADKFPGYVRNENFKKASIYKQKRMIFSNILIYSSLNKTLNILKQLLVKMD